MSDLISRKKVIDILEKEKSLRCGYDADIVIFSIEKGIRELPTAYSVAKVVEYIRCRCYEMGLDESQTEIIVSEIVTQGVVSDDACEWKSASDGELIKNPHTKGLFSNESSMQNVYCNTCGKKIKIVCD